MGATSHPLVNALVAVSLIVSGYTAATLTQSAPTPAKTITGDEVCATGPVRQSIYGDSITSWQPPFNGNWRQSWVFYASNNDYPVTGGWALPGATLAQMAARASNTNADVVTIMGGTNDLPILALGKVGTSRAQMLASIDEIVRKEGTPQRVVILAVAPFGWNYAESNKWNAELRQHAAVRGWLFFDPWTGLRDPAGAWWPGTSTDLVHPAPAFTWHPGGIVFSHLTAIQ